MNITPELTAQILRYHHAEHWPVGTISSQLGVHRETVMRVLTQAGVTPNVPAQRASGVTPYMPFIEQTLVQFPNLTASRLYAMVVERGYLSYSSRYADLLFELISRRHEQKSTLITTNKSFADWGEVFPNAACVVALVDRLVHHAEIVGIKGQSYRQKEAQEHAKARSGKRKTSKVTT